MDKLKNNIKRLAALISASLASNLTHADATAIDPFDNTVNDLLIKADVLNSSVPLQLASHSSHSSHASHSSHRSSAGGGYGTDSTSINDTPSSNWWQSTSSKSAQNSSVGTNTTRAANNTSVTRDDFKNTIQHVQLALTYAGFYQGSIDGIMGPATRAAIVAYRKSKGLTESEYIDAALLNSLGIKYSQ